MQQCASERHMPDIPDINIHDSRHAGHQHEDIHPNGHRYGDKRNLRCPGHRRRTGPANIHDMQIKIEIFRHCFCGRTDRIQHQANN